MMENVPLLGVTSATCLKRSFGLLVPNLVLHTCTVPVDRPPWTWKVMVRPGLRGGGLDDRAVFPAARGAVRGLERDVAAIGPVAAEVPGRGVDVRPAGLGEL